MFSQNDGYLFMYNDLAGFSSSVTRNKQTKQANKKTAIKKQRYFFCSDAYHLSLFSVLLRFSSYWTEFLLFPW